MYRHSFIIFIIRMIAGEWAPGRIAHTLRIFFGPKPHTLLLLLLLYIIKNALASCENCSLIEIIAKKRGGLLCKMWNPQKGRKIAQNMCADYRMKLDEPGQKKYNVGNKACCGPHCRAPELLLSKEKRLWKP